MTPVPTPLATPTPTPTIAPAPTRSPVPTSTSVPTQSHEPECRENFIVENGECICDRKNFISRGGNCYPICGTEAALSDSSLCVCPDGYEKNDFGNCSKRCTMKHAHLSKFGKCECDENFIEKNGRCICDEKESDLIGDKCLLKPGKHEERIINGDDVKYRCKPGYEYDKDKICQKVTSKKPGLLEWLFGDSRSNSTQTPTATPEATIPTPTSNPAPTLEKQKKKEQPKQEPKVLIECYNLKNGDWIIEYDNGETICQNFPTMTVRRCVEKCSDIKNK